MIIKINYTIMSVTEVGLLFMFTVNYFVYINHFFEILTVLKKKVS